MALPVGALGALSGLFSTGLSALSTGQQNRRSMRFAEKMYGRQYNDALAFWNMQNQYNAPEAQMQRFKDAGLNPNLIYGRGDAGQAAQVQSPGVIQPQFKSADFSGLNLAGQYIDMEVKQAQLDNLKKDADVKIQEALLREAQVLAAKAGTARTEFDLAFDKEYKTILGDARKENLRNLIARTDTMINEDERRQAMHSKNLMLAAENILMTRAKRSLIPAEKSRIYEQIKNLKYDKQIKKLDIGLKKLGIQPSDALWQRILARLVGDADVSSDYNLLNTPAARLRSGKIKFK